jgi:methoxymalonate biosynthesis acyl carrier protein
MSPQPAAEGRDKVKQIISTFIINATNLSNLGEDDHLFETGVLNSLFAVQLMTFIEKAFRIEVGKDDLDIDNFKSIRATTAFVLRKNGFPAA